MNQLSLIPRPYSEPRRRPVPTTCPFHVGQTVRNTRLDITGHVLDQTTDIYGSWWVRVAPNNGRPNTAWLASLCEAA